MPRKNSNPDRRVRKKEVLRTLADRYNEKTGEYRKLKYEPAPLTKKRSKKLHGRRNIGSH